MTGSPGDAKADPGCQHSGPTRAEGLRQKGQEAKASAAHPGSLQAGRGRSQLPCYRVPTLEQGGSQLSSAPCPRRGSQFQLPSGLKSFIAFRSSLPGPRYRGEGGKPSRVTGAEAEGTHQIKTEAGGGKELLSGPCRDGTKRFPGWSGDRRQHQDQGGPSHPHSPSSP